MAGGIREGYNDHRYPEENPHVACEGFLVNVRCGFVDGHLLGPVILHEIFTGERIVKLPTKCQ